MDLMDEAQERTERERDAAVARVRARARGLGSPECQGCGEPIEPARRNAMPNATRCIACQESLERYRRQRGR